MSNKPTIHQKIKAIDKAINKLWIENNFQRKGEAP